MCAKLDKEYLIKLTLAVYKVTELFPQEELKHQIRESANRVLADLIYLQNGNDTYPVESLLALFKEAEAKNWVDSRNFLVLYREYDKINQLSAGSKTSGKPVENSLSKNNHRQEKILEVINGNGKTKIGELVRLFPEVNRRTVLRDLEKLCLVGAVARNGNGRGICYTKNGKEV